MTRLPAQRPHGHHANHCRFQSTSNPDRYEELRRRNFQRRPKEDGHRRKLHKTRKKSFSQLRRRHHHIRRNGQTPSVRRKHPPSSRIYDNRQDKHLQRNHRKPLDQLNESGTVNLPPMHQDPTTGRSLHDQRKPKHFQRVLRDITENEGTKEETRRRRQKVKRKTPTAKENI